MNPQNFVLARIFPVNPQNLALFVATKPQNLALFVAMNPQNLETFFLRIKKKYDGFYDICIFVTGAAHTSRRELYVTFPA